jgi:hypothetical protein
MILISHRGNINGRKPEFENNPSYIVKAYLEGYNVEIDVWYIDGEWLLGHDNPQYKTDLLFLKNSNFWCHAKNIEALHEMLKYEEIHCFWHQNDDYTITSKGYIWTFPNKIITENSICVLPELYNITANNCFGICSDFIENYKIKS